MFEPKPKAATFGPAAASVGSPTVATVGSPTDAERSIGGCNPYPRDPIQKEPGQVGNPNPDPDPDRRPGPAPPRAHAHTCGRA